MELESGETVGRGSVVERGDPDRLPRPTSVVVLLRQEQEPEDPVANALMAFADASDEATRGLRNLVQRMKDVASLTQNIESLKIAASTACNMIGVIADVEVNDEETVASLKKALAEEDLDVPQIVDAVQNMLKVTSQLTQLADDGPPFDIHPSFVGKNVS